MTDSYVAALLHERHGYKQARMWDRMREVDKVLAKLGIVVEDDSSELAVADPPENTARPRGRPRK